MSLLARRRAMMGAKADEPNGLADKPLTSLSNGSYEVSNGTIYAYPTIATWNFINAPFKKSIIAKQGDVLRIKAVKVVNGVYADFRVRTNNGLVVINNNCAVFNELDISKTIDTDCEIFGLYFALRTGSITQNSQFTFTVLLNDEVIF